MARNRSERDATLLLNKGVTPAQWDEPCPVQLWEMPDGRYKVRILGRQKVWRQIFANSKFSALRVYNKMVDGFYFKRITLRTWEYGS